MMLATFVAGSYFGVIVMAFMRMLFVCGFAMFGCSSAFGMVLTGFDGMMVAVLGSFMAFPSDLDWRICQRRITGAFVVRLADVVGRHEAAYQREHHAHYQ